MEEIVAALSAIHEPGLFVGKNRVPADALPLEVEGLGLLKWPLTKKMVRQLISRAKPARFGWRDKTLLDKNVRDVWEISPREIRIDKTIWNKTLNPVLEDLKKELGLPEDSQLKAELHNLLIYETGQFFDPHQDSEKCDGMVATMVVMLPCSHTGGSLIIDHQGTKKSIQSSRFPLDKLNFIAFYADCYHEVKPVKSGYRVVLTYNLILKNPTQSIPKVINTSENKNLIQALKDYFPDEECSQEPDYVPFKCIYLLDHEYTQAGLSWRHLKNADQLRAAALKQAADHLGLDIYLALVDIRENWSCEADFDDYWSRRSRRYEYDDEEETVMAYNEKSIELVELIDEEISLQHWLDRDGHSVDLGECHVSKDELGWTKATDQFKPFQTDYEGWMGNYGNTLDRWYHRAAIVLWRKADHYPILFQINPSTVMQELIHSTEHGASPLPISDIISSLLPIWSKYIEYRSEDGSLLSQIVRIASHVKNAELSQKILQYFAIQILTPQNIKLCLALIENYGVSWFLDLMQSWAKPKDKWVRGVEKCKHISQIVKVLAKNSSYQPLIHFLLAYQWQQLQKQYTQNKGITYRSDLLKSMRQLIQDFQELLGACRIIQQEDLMIKIVDHVSSDKRCYPVLDLIMLLDDCEKLCGEKLRNYIRYELQYERDLGLRQKDDWSIRDEISCQCADCAVLKQFLQSDTEKMKVWPLAQGRRQHIHQAIESLDIPVTHKTQHVGSPHKLILTKTELLHSQAKARFTKIKKELLRLSAESVNA